MAIVFAAVVPHSPLFIPSIGQEHADVLAPTLTAFGQIAEGLKTSRAEALLVVSPHPEQHPQGLGIGIRPTFLATAEAFGDFRTTLPLRGLPALGNALKHPFDTKRHQMPISVIADEKLDYGVSTPLFALAKEGIDLPVLPVGLSFEKLGQEFAAGEAMRPLLLEYPKRLAILASANFSHRLSADTPAGFSPRARAFDRRLREMVLRAESSKISRVRMETIKEVDACGLPPLLFLFGLLHGGRLRMTELSYDAPFGIGFPVFQAQL